MKALIDRPRILSSRERARIYCVKSFLCKDWVRITCRRNLGSLGNNNLCVGVLDVSVHESVNAYDYMSMC